MKIGIMVASLAFIFFLGCKDRPNGANENKEFSIDVDSASVNSHMNDDEDSTEAVIGTDGEYEKKKETDEDTSKAMK